jgi:CheY-specific phosphatase CheX
MSTTSVIPNFPAAAPVAPLGGWAPVLEHAAREIFEVMLGLPLQRADAEPPIVADLTVMVGLSGKMRGVFGLHCTAQSACAMASTLLGAATDEFDERVLDAVGEVANMIAGSFKSKVPGVGEGCVLSVPTVISGADYHLHSVIRGEHVEISLTFSGSPLWLTLDLRR